MAATKLAQTALGLTLFGMLAAAVLGGCDTGDTDGGEGNDTSGLGTQFVSDGGSGGTLKITPNKTTINVGEIVGYKVVALDPRGAPLAFVRIFCESEKGIAILEPSSGGVAFESTGPDGLMSGKIGGVTPGSFIMECRGPEGFNLVDRIGLKVVGEIPEGFDGFPGAAGGNLGGGNLVEPPNQDVTLRAVTLINVLGERSTIVDIVFQNLCPGTTTPEPYGADDFIITVTNQREDRITVESVEFDGPGGASSDRIFTPLVIPPRTQTTIQGRFTDVVSIPVAFQKNFATTAAVVPFGTFPVTFTLRGETASGDNFRQSITASITGKDVNNCG